MRYRDMKNTQHRFAHTQAGNPRFRRELQRVATKKSEETDDAVFDCVKSNLESLTAQAETAGEPEYVSKQSARDLAMLHGVMFDKAFRLLEIATPCRMLERLRQVR